MQYTKEQEALNAEYGYNLHTVWSDKPVNMDFTYLRVVLEAGKPIDYSICFGFTDTVDSQMECWSICILCFSWHNVLPPIFDCWGSCYAPPCLVATADRLKELVKQYFNDCFFHFFFML